MRQYALEKLGESPLPIADEYHGFEYAGFPANYSTFVIILYCNGFRVSVIFRSLTHDVKTVLREATGELVGLVRSGVEQRRERMIFASDGPDDVIRNVPGLRLLAAISVFDSEGFRDVPRSYRVMA